MKIRKKAATKGFTLIEIMVAMVVLAIGLLGMAAMTVLVMRGNKGADQITIATSLATQKMEGLKDIGFNNLGTADSAGHTNYSSYGIEGSFFTGPYGPMNALGETSSTSGPDFIFYRSFAICDSPDSVAPCTGSGVCDKPLCQLLGDEENGIGSMTSTVPSQIPEELACSDASAEPDEKRIRVVTYWKDRFGKCHRVQMDTIVVNLN